MQNNYQSKKRNQSTDSFRRCTYCNSNSLSSVSNPSRGAKDSFELLKNIICFVKLRQGLSLADLVSIYNSAGVNDSDECFIPISVFSHSLSPSESLCKYLKENRRTSYSEIAKMINRDDRSVWTSYQRAQRKSKEPFVIDADADIFIPVSVFSDRTKSILEQVVSYLASIHGFSNARIAAVLNKHPASICTIKHRAMQKETAEQRIRRVQE